MVISTENMMTQFGTPIGQTISLHSVEKALKFTSKLPLPEWSAKQSTNHIPPSKSSHLHTWMLHGEYLPSHFQGKI